MADEYIDKVEVGAKIQMMYIRREMDYGGENDFCRGMRKALRVIENMPAADVQPVGFVQNEVLNYLFNKEREAESIPYSDVRQERIATLREVIRYVEGIGDTNG